MSRDKFAVVGFTKHRERAPFGDPEWDVFGMNALYKSMPLDRWPFTGWFQVHTRQMMELNNADATEAFQQFNVPIYMLDKAEWPDVPMAQQIPVKEIEAIHPRLGKYHTSSVSWMVGYAILKEYKEIHVYGIDMASDTEYVYQRPACEAWLAYAEGLGIKTYTPPESDLFSTVAQYGSGDQAAFRTLLFGKIKAYTDRIQGIEQNLAEIRTQYRNVTEDFQHKEKKLLQDMHRFQGQVAQCHDLLQNYTVPEAGGGSPYGQDIVVKGNQIIARPSGDGKPVNRLEAAKNA